MRLVTLLQRFIPSAGIPMAIGVLLVASCGSGLRFSSGGGKTDAPATAESNPADSGNPSPVDAPLEGPGAGEASSLMFKLGEGSDFLSVYQGILPSTADEELTQKNQASGLLDILIVIDNSASMDGEQVNLSTKLSSLLSNDQIRNSDWQIGIVTTDPNDPAFKNTDTKCLRALLKKGDADLETKFAAGIQAGVSGDSSERGILNAVKGLKAECLGGKTWLRDNSTVAVLIVSDEDNCSNGSDLACAGQPDRQSKYLTDYLGKIRVLGEEARIYGILWAPATACQTGLNVGRIYSEAIAVSKGSLGSICDNDYSSTLLNLSRDISTIIRNQFTLKVAPPPGTFAVSINGQLQASGYKVVGKTLTFSTPPAVDSKIRVAYDRSKLVHITSKELPSDAVRVKQVIVAGAVTQPSYWSFDAATHQLTFNVIPEEGAEIRIEFQRPGDITGTQITLPGPVNLSTLEISVIATGTTVQWSAVDPEGCAKIGACLINLSNPDAVPIGTVIQANYN